MMSVVWVVQGALTFSVAACLEVVLVCVFGPERCGPATAWLAPLRLAFCGSVQDARPQDASVYSELQRPLAWLQGGPFPCENGCTGCG